MSNYIILILLVVFCLLMSSFFGKDMNTDISDFSSSFYDYMALSIDGDSISMNKYNGKKILIVNVASKCGFTPQYKDLQVLYEEYGDQLEILGFPANDFLWQEPAKNKEIKNFCSTNYNISFPMFEKIVVKKNKKQHPIYSWLSNKDLNGWNNQAPSWNFCKYLIDENGKLVQYFPSKINPLDSEIIKYLSKIDK